MYAAKATVKPLMLLTRFSCSTFRSGWTHSTYATVPATAQAAKFCIQVKIDLAAIQGRHNLCDWVGEVAVGAQRGVFTYLGASDPQVLADSSPKACCSRLVPTEGHQQSLLQGRAGAMLIATETRSVEAVVS